MELIEFLRLLSASKAIDEQAKNAEAIKAIAEQVDKNSAAIKAISDYQDFSFMLNSVFFWGFVFFFSGLLIFSFWKIKKLEKTLDELIVEKRKTDVKS